MNISINWLKQYVDLGEGLDLDGNKVNALTVKEISDGLTLAGLEAEGFNNLPKVTNVVTAKVISKEKHPNADKLNLCRVTDGKEEYQVVCGAANVDKDQIVAFAKIGAVLGDIKIKEAKLRGVDSFGMICSEKELGIASESQGIMVLPEDTELGLDINDIVCLGDTIVEFNATPNRPDWLSVIGTAREASAVLNRKITYPHIDYKYSNNDKLSNYIGLNVVEENACPIYVARMIKGVKIGQSPLWMQARLKSAGVRPINNIVDVTNYVLMEFGQPLHAFDIRNIDKNIVVRYAKENEVIKALDGKEYKLDSDMLLIADESKPLAIAGVMGGENTSVMNDTDTVVLECAYFEPTGIRKTSKRLGLSSDSSYRFERGIDFGMTSAIADYAANLIAKICGGDVVEEKLESNKINIDKKEIRTDYNRVNKLLGTNFTIEAMAKALTSLSIETRIENNELVSVVPTFRQDVQGFADIAEEIARVIGLDKIGYTMPQLDSVVDIQTPIVRHTKNTRKIAESLGFNEVLNFSFLSSDYLLKFNKNEDDYVKLLNPISQDMAWMRTYLFPSILKNLQLNKNQGYNSIKLFELSKVYNSLGKDKLANEKLHLSFGTLGDYYDPTWISLPKNDTYYYLKGVIENIISSMELNAKFEKVKDVEFLHPGKSANIFIEGEYAGFLGALHPTFLEDLDIKGSCYIAELDFTLMINKTVEKNETEKSTMKYNKFSRFPSVERDLALMVKSEIQAGDIVDTIKTINPLITNAITFDVFEGKPINLGYKSIAVRITFSHMDKTLCDEDINPIISDILKKLEEEYSAVLR